MSLLEDVFLEDEAGEAQQLERVIEGDEFDERPRSDSENDSEKEDEAEEEKRKVEPTLKTRRVVKNPRVTLNPARLTGPRGIQIIPDHFKDFKFTGKGHEKEDLGMLLKKLEHWAYRLYPKFKFEDCLKKIEILGKKRPVAVHLHKIRSDQYLTEETVVQKDSSDDEPEVPEQDEFDKLLQQQIELSKLSTPVAEAKKPAYSTPYDKSLLMPKATSSPSISEEQKQRMLRNKQLAEERRLARLNKNNAQETPITTINEENEELKPMRHNKSNVIDSSDSENDDNDVVNHSITVDVHDINDENDRSDETSSRNVHGDIKEKSTLDQEVIDNDIVDERDKNIKESIIGDVGIVNKDIDIQESVEVNDKNVEINDNSDENNFDSQILSKSKNCTEKYEPIDNVDNISKDVLEVNTEELMDVDFSDDF